MKKLLTLLSILLITGCSADNSDINKVIDSPKTTNEIQDVYETLSPKAKALFFQQSNELTTPVSPRIAELDELTIGCFGPNKVLAMSPNEQNLGGQCCGALKDPEAYELQLKVIEQFKQIHEGGKLIPTDPYDLSVESAQELTEFDRDIVLNRSQQKIYDQATALSHHGGPCCCKCWKWYVMSGLGKKLIVDYNFSAEDLAEMWDISSSCGHDEDTNMNKHYQDKNAGHTH